MAAEPQTDPTGTGWSSRVFSYVRSAIIAPIAAVIKVILMLLLLLPMLLACFWRWLRERKDGFRDQEEEEKDCKHPFPEDLMRRPDPCIYSQTYLQAQGLPVTWNNPDIWVARKATPNIIEPDSYHLEENTDYIVTVQAHNASTDLAVGVRVRLVYRPWSFNSPDLVPVQVDANGNEVFRIVNIPPMGSTVTTFAWRTPPVGPQGSHFCLQAILSHPLDTNGANNLGQENTVVIDTNGQSARVVVPLHNPARVAQRLTITATEYRIEEKETVELRLKYNRGRRPVDTVGRVTRFVPSINPDRSHGPETAFAGLGLEWSKPFTVVKAKYVGMERLRERLIKQDVSLPPTLTLQIVDYDEGVTLAPKETRLMNVAIEPADGVAIGDQFSVNLLALDQSGRLAGGVTVLLKVTEGTDAATHKDLYTV